MSNNNEDSGIRFSEGISMLEEIVSKMENEEYELEEMLEKFQQGIELYKNLQKKLQDVELKIKKVLEEDGNIRIED